MTSDERKAAYCYGVAVEMDRQGARNRLMDYLEKERGLNEYNGSRPVLARKLKYEIGAVGARDAQICKAAPGGAACSEIAACQLPTG